MSWRMFLKKWIDLCSSSQFNRRHHVRILLRIHWASFRGRNNHVAVHLHGEIGSVAVQFNKPVSIQHIEAEWIVIRDHSFLRALQYTLDGCEAASPSTLACQKLAHSHQPMVAIETIFTVDGSIQEQLNDAQTVYSITWFGLVTHAISIHFIVALFFSVEFISPNQSW